MRAETRKKKNRLVKFVQVSQIPLTWIEADITTPDSIVIQKYRESRQRNESFIHNSGYKSYFEP
jgi:enterochelin esterase-like enzyme